MSGGGVGGDDGSEGWGGEVCEWSHEETQGAWLPSQRVSGL